MLFVLFVAVNEGIGEVVPEVVLNPIAVLLVPLHANEVPVPKFGELAVKLIELIEDPAHVAILAIGFIIGFGLIVIV